ncbi:hypothetical protein GCM10020000_14520 [Streptomyces olivoverticillatus]
MHTTADAAGAAAALAAVPAAERVALVDARFTGHLHALRLALTDPRFPAGATPGALTAQPEARGALTRAMESVTRPAPAEPVHPAPLPDALATRLEADGIAVHRPELGVLVAAVPEDAEGRAKTQAEADAVDEEAVRLRSAVKSRDGFFTTFCISPYSRYLARWCARRGLTPNQVTTASLLTALIAAGCAATGTRPGFVAAGVLLIASFVLDCTDGQLARYSLQYSTLGAWLDATFDRAKEYAYYAGLALGAARGGGHDDVWALALGAMVLQTCSARRRLRLQRGQPRRHRQHQPHRSPLRQARQRRLDRLGPPHDRAAHRRALGADSGPHGAHHAPHRLLRAAGRLRGRRLLHHGLAASCAP